MPDFWSTESNPQTCYINIHFSFHSVRLELELCCSNCLYSRKRTKSKCCTNDWLTQQITEPSNPPSMCLTSLPNLSVLWRHRSCRTLGQTRPSPQFSAQFTLRPVPIFLEVPIITPNHLFPGELGSGVGNLLSVLL